MAGRIFDIQRFCIHDGPGIRTTVFLKGCPLRCLWCHNPEGWSPVPELSFQPEKCIGCGYCLRTCPRRAHEMQDGRHVLFRERCIACGECTRECYACALERVGRELTVDEVLEEVLRDAPFYHTSGGGLTLSGGEPLEQAAFCEALLAAAKGSGLHCCVETCGEAGFATFERLLPHVDLFLYDLKETDPDAHRACTGVTNTRILDNLRALHARGVPIRLRLPIIPGVNDRPGHFEALGRLCAELPRLEGAEVMPYHALGTGKRLRLGHDGRPGLDVAPVATETADAWRAALRRCGVPVA